MRQREPQLDTESAAKIEFRKSVEADAQDVIFRVFPSKILELQNLITSTSSPSSPFHQSHATEFTDLKVYPPPSTSNSAGESDKKKRKREVEETNSHESSDTQHARFPNVFHANRHIVSVHETLKKECEQLIELTDKVKLWINLTMPKIEDGDNFGVQIQEEVLNELHRSQESGYNMRDCVRQNHLNRAKISSKIIKYPHLEDYGLALKEHDDKQLYIARQNLSDLRNVYAVVTDMLHKNITKLRSPKGNNGVSLY
ncbi:proteasome activator pa28 REG alpha/beta subunit [Lactarius akahatsu]|uniref:Proteasome activator pa28 REG alpha/beta subunit n=1 Tax=Lactarius akahatsu TaxID=416441 RepID=A0AAD4LKI0_9AGAM|nr:proteasome activator pa28 REG alpha/beta subunit [Lactarius akahatsu]